MSTTEKRQKKLLDDLGLADDDFTDLLGHLLVSSGKVTDDLGFGGSGGHKVRLS
jgi:hypothetical protein